LGQRLSSVPVPRVGLVDQIQLVIVIHSSLQGSTSF
jgi:hypothetical protein